MPLENAAITPGCAGCEAVWLPADPERWRAYHGGDELEDLPEIVFYYPECSEREFGSNPIA